MKEYCELSVNRLDDPAGVAVFSLRRSLESALRWSADGMLQTLLRKDWLVRDVFPGEAGSWNYRIILERDAHE